MFILFWLFSERSKHFDRGNNFRSQVTERVKELCFFSRLKNLLRERTLQQFSLLDQAIDRVYLPYVVYTHLPERSSIANKTNRSPYSDCNLCHGLASHFLSELSLGGLSRCMTAIDRLSFEKIAVLQYIHLPRRSICKSNSISNCFVTAE